MSVMLRNLKCFDYFFLKLVIDFLDKQIDFQKLSSCIQCQRCWTLFSFMFARESVTYRKSILICEAIVALPTYESAKYQAWYCFKFFSWLLVRCTDEPEFSPSLNPLVHSSVCMPFTQLKCKILLNARFEVFST